MIKKRMQQIGLTPAKAVLIGVLVLVFVAVVLSNFLPEESSATTTTAKRRKGNTKVSRKVKSKVAKANDSLNTEERELKKWPDIKLALAIQHDPFALPLPLRPKQTDVVAEKTNEQSSEIDEEAERQRRLFELRERRRKKLEKIKSMQETGIAIVLVTAEERVVKIGNKKLHVGDLWEGFRIIEIRNDGSVVVDIN